MGKPTALEDYFRKRLKALRQSRGWSQSDVAKMLSDKGITQMYGTTIAKIEAGDRSVRIDEAAEIAELFGIALDDFVGRRGAERDRAHSLTAVADEAQKLVLEVIEIRDRVIGLTVELQAQFGLEQPSVDKVMDFDWVRTLPVEEQRAALMSASSFVAAAALDRVVKELNEAVTQLHGVVAFRSVLPAELADVLDNEEKEAGGRRGKKRTR